MLTSTSNDGMATPNGSLADGGRRESKVGTSGRRKHRVRKSERRQSTEAKLQAEELPKHNVTDLKDAPLDIVDLTQ